MTTRSATYLIRQLRLVISQVFLPVYNPFANTDENESPTENIPSDILQIHYTTTKAKSYKIQSMTRMIKRKLMKQKILASKHGMEVYSILNYGSGVT